MNYKLIMKGECLVIEKALKRLGEIIYQFRYLLVFLWFAAIVIGAFFALKLPDLLTGGGWDSLSSGSAKVIEKLDKEFPKDGKSTLTLIYHNPNYEVNDFQYMEHFSKVLDFLEEKDYIKSIYSLKTVSDGEKSTLIGKDFHTTIAILNFNLEEGYALKETPSLQSELNELFSEEAGVKLLGSAAFWGEVSDLSIKGLEHAHLYALPIIVVILLLVFRTVASTFTPIVVGLSSILVSLGILYGLATQTELSIFVLESAAMIGLGVGIDFSLIYVMRFKEELERLKNVKEAIVKATETAGHAIFFSGITIIGSMSTLFLVDLAAVRSIALGVVVVVLILVLSSLTLLPAVLSILGSHINFGKLPSSSKRDKESIWYRFSHAIMRRPVLYLIIGIFFCLFLAVPAKNLTMVSPDTSMLPKNSEVRQGLDILEKNFGEGFTTPIQLILESNNNQLFTEKNIQLLKEFVDELEQKDQVKEVRTVTLFESDTTDVLTLLKNKENLPAEVKVQLSKYIGKNNQTIYVEIITNSKGSSDENNNLVIELQNKYAKMWEKNEIVLYVGGETARSLDNNEVLANSLVPTIIVVVALIYVVLWITFKSVVIPLKAILMNLLSLAATYGLLVLIYQVGILSFLGVEPVGYIQSFLPVLLMALLFSLSTDYEVFLLSRVQEEFNKNHDNEESVAIGLEKTAPMITGAAIIMISVFLSFSLAGVLPMQQLGIGMAIAIFLDATLIRLIIVPTTMKLLGEWNWWNFKLRK